MTWTDSTLPIDERLDALMDELTLTDLVHQLGSYWHPGQTEAPAPDPDHHDVAPMESEFSQELKPWTEAIDGGLGHLTRVFGTDPLTVPDGVAKLTSFQDDVRAANPHRIPAIAHEECLTGFTALGATVYPASIAWGATWRPELIEEMAAAIGADLASVGVQQGLSPLLDVVRDYRWGRVEETCGEDPYLVGTLGTAYVRGLQSAGVVATPKHFVGYPASRSGRNHAPVSMGRRELEDVMLPPFEMAVRVGGAGSIMNSYCDIDGQPAAASHELLTTVLRDRWGFEGTVVSDYWSIAFLTRMHRVAPDDATAAALALRAGLDIELPSTGAYWAIEEAIGRGLLSEDEVRRAARRVLRQKLQLGLLDDGWQPPADPAADLDSPRNRDIARRVAEESVTLLANDGVLPLAEGRKVAVVGPTWDDVRAFMGCYSFPNHVLAKSGTETGLDIRRLDDALRAALGDDVTFATGTGFTSGTDEDLAAAVAAAAAAEVAVVTLGDIAGMFGEGTSGEGCDVVDLKLPGRQGELLDAVLATGTPTILLLVTGRPYALGEYADRCAAIVQAFMPGVEAADVLAGVLTGTLNPSGRLPIAIPSHHGGQPGTYLAPPLGWFSNGISNLDPTPLFPFGHGIGYATFELSDAAVSAPTMPVDGVVEYSVTVTNTGDRDGAEVVQLYSSDPWAEVVRPLKQLIGYRKVDLSAGESARVTFEVHADRLSFTGVDMARVVEPGEIQLSAGRSSEDRLPALSVEMTGERRVVGEGRVLVTPSTVVPA
ncbi:glycosyl hydrolase [Tessaracoccus lapidicaptus]|uniref:Exo-alpha-(1->6)-L-arabinopyranosidase n=1 Tax=Tessaracoccus lapidicaptus TaxID=1427523 RepID=A0A1C0ALP7_9ACTN|nr:MULTISPECIES: glycoside hydrolase family 3 N-terminal domain-containing protein [Tessaracoccus]AQX16123.1 glycosyl hydrolase [Tessaracoccus sp. T2.5-30]OCL33425.1 glycosyl hydrolase [Tessaracoccus lapidicaptus]VEP40677.1 Thermostable beta-glucosidase B [Tessaracoccus lapidicaptus]